LDFLYGFYAPIVAFFLTQPAVLRVNGPVAGVSGARVPHSVQEIQETPGARSSRVQWDTPIQLT